MAQKTLQERVRETIYPNGVGAITAEKEQALLIDFADVIDEKANKSDIPDEVYIGETEPTDEKVKVWINPNEEANTIQARTTSGGGTSGGYGQIVVYNGTPIIEETSNSISIVGYSLTEEQKKHNAEMYNLIAQSPYAVFVTLDLTDLFKSQFGDCKVGLPVGTLFLPDMQAVAIGTDFVTFSDVVMLLDDGSILLE